MFLKIVLLSVLALILQHAFKLYLMMEFGKQVYNQYPGPCEQVEGIDFGSENFFMLSSGLVFITSGVSFSKNNPTGMNNYFAKNNIKGRIYMLDMKNPKVVKEMSLTSSKDFDRESFFPHGISGWEDKQSGKLYLFVVNHEKSGIEKVEKFLVSMETLSLKHIKSYLDGAFMTLNDIAMTGPDSFYFTNSMSSSSYFGRIFEILAMIPWANVGYFDGVRSSQVADGLRFANGISMSTDGRWVYVMASNNRQLRTYDRRDDNSLNLVEAFQFDSSPDNAIVDPTTGDLYVGFHPVTHLAFAYMDNPELRSPSQVLQLKLKNGSVSSVKQLFTDDGKLISGSAVAAVYKKKLLIGSVLDKLVYCDITVPM